MSEVTIGGRGKGKTPTVATTTNTQFFHLAIGLAALT
jgi:hypothetical protein